MGYGVAGVTVSVRDYSTYVASMLRGFVCMEGVTVRGPVNTPTLVSSWPEFQRKFGGYHDDYDFPELVKRALDYGARVVVNRIVHYTSITDKTSITATASTVTLVDRDGADTLGITAANEGAWSDGELTVAITDGTLDPANEFNMTVALETDPDLNETYQNLSMDPDADNYVLKVVNAASELIKVANLSSATTAPGNRPAVDESALTGGTDGLVGLNSNDYIGNETQQLGFYAFDSIDYSIVLSAPECVLLSDNGEAVHVAGLAYCSTHREGMMGYVGTFEAGVTATGARTERIAWSLNNWAASMFYGEPEVVDPVTGNSTKYINCLGDVLGCIARSHKERKEWFPAAGTVWGKMINVLGFRNDVGSAGRKAHADILADAQINPCMTVRGIGPCVWGMDTTQKTASALRQLPTAWLVMVMKSALLEYGRGYCFMPNGPTTWRLMANELTPWLEQLKAETAFYAYALQCDQDAPDIESGVLNTPVTIERGELKCRIYIKPMIFAKWIGFEVVLTKTSARFQDFYNIAEL